MSKNIDFPLLGHIRIKHHQNWNRDRSQTDGKQKLTRSHVSSRVATHPHAPPHAQTKSSCRCQMGSDFAVAICWAGLVGGPIQPAWTAGQLEQSFGLDSLLGCAAGRTELSRVDSRMEPRHSTLHVTRCSTHRVTHVTFSSTLSFAD